MGHLLRYGCLALLLIGACAVVAQTEPRSAKQPAPSAVKGTHEIGHASEPPPASKQPGKSPSKPVPARLGANAKSICPLLDPIAEKNGLPPLFFARLIWHESRFDAEAISHKGAQGVAQFMPGTAALRGLEDPFEPLNALRASAAFLADLRGEFGNLGLAAAAYNAGPQRVRDWLVGRGGLPLETHGFVWKVTGKAPDEWKLPGSGQSEVEAGSGERTQTLTSTAKGKAAPVMTTACEKLAALLANPAAGGIETAPPAPWGMQIAGGFSRERALAAFRRIRQAHKALLGDRKPLVIRVKGSHGRGRHALYGIRIGTPTQAEADGLCADLRAAGGACIVLRN